MPELTLSRKQHEAYELLNDPEITELNFGGGAGGGKSWLICLWAVIECRKYPGITIGLGRKEITNLRKTTAQTLLTEVHPALGVTGSDFTYHPIVDPGVYYENGSSIVFIDLAPSPTDPEYDRFGSLSLTHVIIEEAGEVVSKARSVITSRKNRKLNDNYGITGKAVLTCNPSQNFIREEFYEPYLKLGGGESQVWQYANDAAEPVYVSVNGKRLRAKRAFVRSLPTDNPFLSLNYIENLRSMPEAERRRLLYGDWDYDTADNSVFKREVLNNVTLSELPIGEFDNFAGLDVAREGKDRSVIAKLRGNMLTDIVIYKKEDLERFATPEEKQAPPYSHILGRKFIQYCNNNAIGYQHTGADAVGLGAGVVDYCRSEGFYIAEYKAGSKPIVKLSPAAKKLGKVVEYVYDMLRSQVAKCMADDMERGDFLLWEGCPYLAEVKKELLYHNYNITDKVMKIESKEQLKKRLGKSPDVADAVFIAYYKWKFGRAGTHIEARREDVDDPTALPGTHKDERPITSGMMGKSF